LGKREIRIRAIADEAAFKLILFKQSGGQRLQVEDGGRVSNHSVKQTSGKKERVEKEENWQLN